MDNGARDNCIKVLGCVASSNNPPLLDFHDSIINFVKALQTPGGPNSDEFNCFPENHITIKTGRLFKDIICIDKSFVIQPHVFQPNCFPWSIALYDIPWALYVF